MISHKSSATPNVEPDDAVRPDAVQPDAVRSAAKRTLERLPLERGAQPTSVIVAFSGGPDSLALLWATSSLAETLHLQVIAVHLDHNLDEGSANRALRAGELAESLGVPFESERLESPVEASQGGIEAAARTERYRYLERCRKRLRARYVLTAHHADDQIETVLLRFLYGSGIDGLAGIPERREHLVRPLLGVRRSVIERCLSELGLEATIDPTNQSGGTTRNRVRLHLLPDLRGSEPGLEERLLRLTAQARATRDYLDQLFDRHLHPEPLKGRSGLRVERLLVEQMSKETRRAALSYLHRSSGADYPGTSGAQRELDRQLAGGGRVGIDCGAGWRWTSRGRWLNICRASEPD